MAIDDMKLPAGLTCSDCGFFHKCIAFGIASANDKSDTCDWSPSKFWINPAKLIEARNEISKLTQMKSDYQKGKTE